MRYSIRSTVTITKVFEESIDSDSVDEAQARATQLAIGGLPALVVSQVCKIDTDIVRVEAVSE